MICIKISEMIEKKRPEENHKEFRELINCKKSLMKLEKISKRLMGQYKRLKDTHLYEAETFKLNDNIEKIFRRISGAGLVSEDDIMNVSKSKIPVEIRVF